MPFTAVKRLFEQDIWRASPKDISAPRRFCFRTLRIAVITVRGFQKDHCPQIATSLTFYSLLSIIPVLALAFGIAKGFGFEKILERELMEKFGAYSEVGNKMFEFSHSLLESAKGGVIAGVGAAFLIWSVIRLLTQIETALDQICGVTMHRHSGRRFVDYLAVMLIAPLLLVMYSSAMVFISSSVSQQTSLFSLLGPVAFILIRISPFVILCGMLTLIYVLMPNIHIRLSTAITAGLVAGTLLHVVQQLLVALQIDVSRYNAIYGGFSAIPVFLLWLQAGWLIVLLGGELCYALQNNDHFDLHPDFQNISTFLKRSLALAMVHKIVRPFMDGRPPLSSVSIASDLRISQRLADVLLDNLVSCGILARLRNEGNAAPLFLPARDPAGIHVADVLKALDHRGIDRHSSIEDKDVKSVLEFMRRMEEEVATLPGNRPVRELWTSSDISGTRDRGIS